MKYYGVEHYGNALAHRAKYGTADSTSNEKGADNKKNNTSEYNHDYYMRNKSKWQDNDSGSSSSGSKESDEDKASDEDKEFDVDAAARDVIRGMYGNGAERKAALGDDYDAVQKRVNELMKQMGINKGEKDSNKSDDSGDKKSGNSNDKNAWKDAKSNYFDKKKKK